MTKEEQRPHSQVAGISIGLVVFFVGVGLLIFVFSLASKMFGDTTLITGAATHVAAASKNAVPDLTSVATAAGARIIALFIMLLSGSLVASKGIQLYMASR